METVKTVSYQRECSVTGLKPGVNETDFEVSARNHQNVTTEKEIAKTKKTSITNFVNADQNLYER